VSERGCVEDQPQHPGFLNALRLVEDDTAALLIPHSALKLVDEVGIAPTTVLSRSRFRIGVLVYAGPHPWRNVVVLPH